MSAFNGNNIHAVLAELHKYATTAPSTFMHLMLILPRFDTQHTTHTHATQQERRDACGDSQNHSMLHCGPGRAESDGPRQRRRPAGHRRHERPLRDGQAARGRPLRAVRRPGRQLAPGAADQLPRLRRRAADNRARHRRVSEAGYTPSRGRGGHRQRQWCEGLQRAVHPRPERARMDHRRRRRRCGGAAGHLPLVGPDLLPDDRPHSPH